jgi:hypothetical protein
MFEQFCPDIGEDNIKAKVLRFVAQTRVQALCSWQSTIVYRQSDSMIIGNNAQSLDFRNVPNRLSPTSVNLVNKFLPKKLRLYAVRPSRSQHGAAPFPPPPNLPNNRCGSSRMPLKFKAKSKDEIPDFEFRGPRQCSSTRELKGASETGCRSGRSAGG